MKPSTAYSRLRAYTLWTLVVLAAVFTAAVTVPFAGSAIASGALAVMHVAGVVVLGVTSSLLSWQLAARVVEGSEVSRGLIVGHIAVSAAVVGVTVLARYLPIALGDSVTWPYHAAVVAGLALLPLSTSLSTRLIGLLPLAVTAAALVNLAAWGEGSWANVAAISIPSFLMSAGMFATVRLSVWYLELTHKEIESAWLRADLAVAEERLRFSRDLHDIFGRTLTAVAVKSDLAAELAEHGRPDDAAREMRSVNALAQEALGEVRQVVAGYRAPDFDTELRGARALLESSGIEARVLGEAEDAAPEVFAWVVREGVTNVLRHSNATRCVIRVGSDSVEIENDGAVPGSAVVLGSGLLGLQDRMHAVGGVLDVRCEGGVFTLRAQTGEKR